MQNPLHDAYVMTRSSTEYINSCVLSDLVVPPDLVAMMPCAIAHYISLDVHVTM